MIEISRFIEVFKNNKWVKAEFIDLRPGTKFRMYEDSARTQRVTNDQGYTEFCAASFPYEITNEDGVKTLAVNMEG
jgi:hypothetical protein